MKGYVDNAFDASIVSEDASIKFNQLEMTKDEFKNLANIHHAMFNEISFPDGWVETVNYIGSDIKNAGGRYIKIVMEKFGLVNGPIGQEFQKLQEIH